MIDIVIINECNYTDDPFEYTQVEGNKRNAIMNSLSQNAF